MIASADIERARARVDIYAAATALKRSGAWMIGRCPLHDDHDPSFGVKAGRWTCFSGCGHGDVIEFYQRWRHCSFQEAVREILGLPLQPAREASPAPMRGGGAEPDQDKAQAISNILASCVPITDRTAAWTYLHMRGLARIRQDVLLAHPALYCAEIRKPLPALVAPITDSADRVTAVQRIWLLSRVEYVAGEIEPKDNRAPLQARKKSLGSLRDGAVRLRPAGKVLGLAEGVETALACMAVEKGVPVWATCGVQRLMRVWIPPTVERLLIFGDNGAIGTKAAQQAAAWWRSEGIDAEPVFPDPRVDDFNSLWLAMEAA